MWFHLVETAAVAEYINFSVIKVITKLSDRKPVAVGSVVHRDVFATRTGLHGFPRSVRGRLDGAGCRTTMTSFNVGIIATRPLAGGCTTLDVTNGHMLSPSALSAVLAVSIDEFPAFLRPRRSPSQPGALLPFVLPGAPWLESTPYPR